MKKLILILALCVSTAFIAVKAQTINGVKLTELKAEYLEVSAYRQSNSDNKMYVVLEYGQQVRDNRPNLVVKDEKGKNFEYDSALDFINKMEHYELFQVYAVVQGDYATKYYVLKRKK